MVMIKKVELIAVQPEDNNREQQRNRVKKHIIFLSF
jgi:hypothetical protein